MQEVHDMFVDQDFASIILGHDADKDEAIEWINAHSFHWTEWGWDPISPVYHPIFTAYKVYCGGSNGIPQTYLVDADGNVRWAKLGMISDNSLLIAVINQLI